MNKFVKYLLCILFSILALNFLVNMVYFFKNINTYLIPSQIDANPTSSKTISTGKEVEKSFNKVAKELTDNFGDEYPAQGILYYKAINHYSSVYIVQNFIFSLIAGFILGNLIFILFISNFNKYLSTSLFILNLFLYGFLLTLSDLLTTTANSKIAIFKFSDIVWNMEYNLIIYCITLFVLYIIKVVVKNYYEIKNSD